MRHVRYFYILLLTQQKQKPKQLLHKGIKPSKTLQLERHVKKMISRRFCKELFTPVSPTAQVCGTTVLVQLWICRLCMHTFAYVL